VLLLLLLNSVAESSGREVGLTGWCWSRIIWRSRNLCRRLLLVLICMSLPQQPVSQEVSWLLKQYWVATLAPGNSFGPLQNLQSCSIYAQLSRCCFWIAFFPRTISFKMQCSFQKESHGEWFEEASKAMMNSLLSQKMTKVAAHSCRWVPYTYLLVRHICCR